jgi:type IX secretion system PorP/SprF family membrane protein
MNRIIVAGIFLGFTLSGYAQNNSLYTNYYVNPYLYNPAEAATSYSTLQVNYRQQWMGFHGAPQTTTASFSTLLDGSRAGIGFKASCFARGILKTTDLLFSYSYAIPFSFSNHLYLGLSGGFISHNIDLTNVDTSDPAIRNYTANNVQPAGNFGALLRLQNGINLGVTLPQIFTEKYTAETHFENRNTSPTDDVIFSAYYKKKLESKLPARTRTGRKKFATKTETFAPLELYTVYRLSKLGEGQLEGIIKINLSGNCWLAGGYRQNNGFIGSFGLRVTDNLMLTYGYESGTQMAADYAPDSHEIQVGLRFGKIKNLKRPAPSLHSTLKSRPEHHMARFQESSEHTGQLSETKLYYVVIRGFNDFTGADAFKAKLISQKYNAQVYFQEKEKKYYVYVFVSKKSHEAYHEARQLRNFTKLKEARVLTVDVKVKEGDI